MVSRSVSKEFGRMSGMFSDYSNNVVVVLCIWPHQYSVAHTRAHTLNCGHNDKVEQHFNISCHLTILLVALWRCALNDAEHIQPNNEAAPSTLSWHINITYFDIYIHYIFHIHPQSWKKTVSFYRQTFKESSGFCILLNCTISATTARATTFSNICFNTF